MYGAVGRAERSGTPPVVPRAVGVADADVVGGVVACVEQERSRYAGPRAVPRQRHLAPLRAAGNRRRKARWVPAREDLAVIVEVYKIKL